jgi:hypothetical protein
VALDGRNDVPGVIHDHDLALVWRGENCVLPSRRTAMASKRHKPEEMTKRKSPGSNAEAP